MNEYEILLLLDPDLDEDRQSEVVARARELVERAGGSWDLHDVWGRRKLAYEIGHKGEGVYHLLQFTCDADTLDEISRVLRIDDARHASHGDTSDRGKSRAAGSGGRSDARGCRDRIRRRGRGGVATWPETSIASRSSGA